MKPYTAYFFSAIALLLHSCNVPQDPDNSWQHAQLDGLLVGIVNNAPFTVFKQEKYAGSEVEMVTDFATENHLQIKWVQASESQLVEMMKAYKLHLVIGGFDKKTVWASEVGITKSYDDKHVWLVARGENELVEQVEKYFLKKEKSL